MAAYLPEIRSIIRDLLHDNDIDVAPETRFDDLIGWDSMDLVSVVVEVECYFGLQFELPEIDRLATIADLSGMIEAKQALASV
nr:acyl carrier protein [uncultured Rhodopila sp.]